MSRPVIEPLSLVVDRYERAYLVAALRAHGGSRVATARTLRVSRKTLWKKAARYEIAEAEITAPAEVPAPSADSPKCARKGDALARAERAVLEAAGTFADELIAPCEDDDEAWALVRAVAAWREAQSAHGHAAVEALAGVTS